VPLSFEANQGQTDGQVKFLSHGDGYSLFLTSNEVVSRCGRQLAPKLRPSGFRMELREPIMAPRLPAPMSAVATTRVRPKKWR